MSRYLKQSAAELESKAQKHASILRRTLQDYSNSVQDSSINLKLQSKKDREIERAVAHITRVNKALKRVRKKMRKSK